MKCKITLKDEVNCKVEGLNITTRRKCEKELKFFWNDPVTTITPRFYLRLKCQHWFCRTERHDGERARRKLR